MSKKRESYPCHVCGHPLGTNSKMSLWLCTVCLGLENELGYERLFRASIAMREDPNRRAAGSRLHELARWQFESQGKPIPRHR